MPKFTSVGSAASRGLRDYLVEQEVKRRQSLLDGIAVEDRMRQQARQDMQDARQAEQDKLNVEHYNQERSDRLMVRADTEGQRYLANEREDVQRKEAETQRNLDRADAAGQRYQDAELRRQDQDAQREFQHSENEAQRANNRNVAAMQIAGSGAKQTEGQRKTGGLLSRAQASLATADKLETSVSTVDLLAPNFLRSEKGQQYRQAAKQWIQSVLRDESGAAIGADEEAYYFETYFRQPGDSSAVIRQKQGGRDSAEDAMAEKVGGSTKPMASHGDNSGGDWRDHGNGVRVRRKN